VTLSDSSSFISDLTAGNRNLSEEKPLGSFFDVNGHVETVLQSEAKVAAARSVCKIFSPTKDGTLTATGFRVGSRFIMTACHVTRSFLEGCFCFYFSLDI
jgi:V8-like Glu-specific endopeptidase